MNATEEEILQAAIAASMVEEERKWEQPSPVEWHQPHQVSTTSESVSALQPSPVRSWDDAIGLSTPANVVRQENPPQWQDTLRQTVANFVQPPPTNYADLRRTAPNLHTASGPTFQQLASVMPPPAYADQVVPSPTLPLPPAMQQVHGHPSSGHVQYMVEVGAKARQGDGGGWGRLGLGTGGASSTALNSRNIVFTLDRAASLETFKLAVLAALVCILSLGNTVYNSYHRSIFIAVCLYRKWFS
eukprot:SAG31_NODE_10757_length_1101_cov_1.775449_2_plen_244_part_00